MFSQVIEYVNKGLPEDHWYRDSFCSNIGSKAKVWMDWCDIDKKHEYDSYPEDVKYSARFRDGLVNDIYTEFIMESEEWGETYKEHSEIVYNYLQLSKESDTDGNGNDTRLVCSDSKHIIALESTEDLPRGLCCTGRSQLDLMNYHLNNVEGSQSQSYMKYKVLDLIASDVSKLPMVWASTHGKPHIQSKWLHALSVVLYTLSSYFFWLEFKLSYGSELEYLSKQIEPRVKQALSHLYRDNVFNSTEMYPVLVALIQYIEDIADNYARLKRELEGYGDIDLKPFLVGIAEKYKKEITKLHLAATSATTPPTGRNETDDVTTGYGENEDVNTGDASSAPPNSPTVDTNAHISSAVSAPETPSGTANTALLIEPTATGTKRKRDDSGSKPAMKEPEQWLKTRIVLNPPAEIKPSTLEFCKSEISLATDEDLDLFRAKLVEACILAVRKSGHTEKLSSRGTKRPQCITSEEVSLELPGGFCFARQLLGVVGTMKHSSSRMVVLTVDNENYDEMQLFLPTFPFIIKRCAHYGPFVTLGRSQKKERYCFTDAIVESAEIKITNKTFSITLKSRAPDAQDEPWEDPLLWKHAGSYEVWKELFELDPDLLQNYRSGTEISDIPGHLPILL